MIKKMMFAAACAAGALLSTGAAAQTAITFTGGIPTTNFPNRTLGYEFTVNSAINIGQLGFYDQGGDGLTESHQVGIWNASGSTLLGSAIIPGGNVASLIDGFRFVDISTLALGPGSYLAGAFLGTNQDAGVRYADATTISQITLGSTRFSAPGISTFSAPTGSQGRTFDDGYFGANFRLATLTAAVPEPASWAMMIGGFGVVGGTMRRKRKVNTTVSFA